MLLLMFVSAPLFAKGEWRELQVIEVPQGTPIFYEHTDNGKIKYFIKVQDFTVPVSETNAKKFVNGQIKLELVKWQNVTNGKYKYTTRRKTSENVDLFTVFP